MSRKLFLSGVAAFVLGATQCATLVASSPSGAALSPCPVVSKYPVKPVPSAVVSVLTKYFAAKHLTPITINKNQEMILSVSAQSVGVHYCKNPDGSTSGYTGAVPKGAAAAVMVFVRHKAYPVTESTGSFVTLAKLTTGWKVVGEGTGP